MKGLVLAGGRGTRLRPLTHTRAKQLLPIAGEPILHHILNDMGAAGLTECVIVVSPDTGPAIRAACAGSFAGMAITYVVQEEPLGLAHAVATARPALGDDNFLLVLGDNVLRGGVGPAVATFADRQPDALILLAQVEHPEQFGVAELAGERVVRLVEKPQVPPSDLALVGVYIFTPAIHASIERLSPSARGEYEITDAIQGLIDEGLRVSHRRVDGWWKDTGKPEDIVEANRLLLADLETRVDGVTEGCRLSGPVVVEEGARLVDTVVTGPAWIGAGTVVEGAEIGPGTSIGRNCRVRTAEIADAIIMDDCTVMGVTHPLVGCLIGEGCRVEGDAGGRGHLGLVLGDRSQVSVPD